jgi:hypothetical protein
LITEIPYYADHEARALSKMASQFPRDGTVAGLVRVAAGRWQAVEDAFFGLIDAFNLETATGAQLLVLGRLVGQEKGGLDDDTYRLYIKARIAANRSSGTPEELINIARLLSTGGAIHYTPYTIASFVLFLEGPVENGVLIAQLILRAEAAGVNGTVEWSEYPPDETFTLDAGPGLDVGHLANSLSL